MKSRSRLARWMVGGGLAFVLGAVSAGAAEVTPKSPGVARNFDVRDVTLLAGPFRAAQERDVANLLAIDPDRLLAWFRKNAGLEPRGDVYGGWESQGVAGHCLGHYLSACARAFHVTGNVEFRNRVARIVEELAQCQQAGGDGLVAAIPDVRKIFAEVSRGDIRSQGFDLNGSWVPWYTLHKQFAGLIDAHRLCENKQALEVACRLADWAIATTKDLTDEQWQKMLACEHGGMNESLADLYALTGESKYLDLAKKFYHRAILDPLAGARDELAGKHSNTQVPKVIGAARIAELTGDAKFAAIARFYWETMVANHTYVMGGNSIGEHLGEPGKLNDRLGSTTAETCNTYNLLKLTAALHAQKPSSIYADYAERALWNHILASQSSETGRVCYYVPLSAGAKKPFQDPEAFTCCSGSGMENHVRYGEYLYSRTADALYVNQFISSAVQWRDRGVTLRQTAGLPETGHVRLEIETKSTEPWTLAIRRPQWVAGDVVIQVNGEALAAPPVEEGYWRMARDWKSGDVVEFDLPLTLRLEAMPDNPRRVAACWGPVVLAGLIGDAAAQITPVLVTNDQPVARWLQSQSNDNDSSQDDSSQDDSSRDRQGAEPAPAFRTVGVGRPKEFAFVPFSSVVDQQYQVYWDLFTADEWAARKAEYEAEQRRQRELEARTVDLFAIGEMQPERDHNVQGEKTSAMEALGRKLRHAWDGGWFSFDVKLPEQGEADLVITYWGSESGPRTFDVLCDGQKLATTTLRMNRPEKFWDEVYPLPAEATTGKAKSTIKFQAHPGNLAGGVFGVRVVRREASAGATTP